MAHGVFQVFPVTIASATSLSSEIDFGRSFAKVYLDPTGAKSEVRFQAAATSGGTYRQVLLPQDPGTSTVQSNIWKVASAASGSIIEVPAGFRFFKVETIASCVDGASLKLFCSDL